MRPSQIVKDMISPSRHEPIITPKYIREGKYVPPEKPYKGPGHYCKVCEQKRPEKEFAMMKPKLCKHCTLEG